MLESAEEAGKELNSVKKGRVLLMAAGYGLIVLAVFTGELCIKNRIERKEREQTGRTILRGRILLRKHHNQGAALGLGKGKRRMVLALSAAYSAVLALFFILSLGQRGNGLLRTGLALLLGGAFSNTYDRMRRKYVVDYFSFQVKWKPLRRVVFNLSDFCIIIGALLVIAGTDWRCG